jgi:hypothetical protein
MKYMDRILDLYKKERDFESKVFGSYADVESLNLASFIAFIEEYIKKVRSSYTGKWDSELPPWLITCREYELHGNAPVKAYEDMIKIMALAGAVLETYTQIDVSKWREDLEAAIQKWK